MYSGVNRMTSEIPHRLGLVIDYVNTLDLDTGTDALATPGGAIEWLTEKGLLKADAADLDPEQLQQTVSLREALRALMLEHNGGPHPPLAAQELQRAARRGELGVHFGADAEVRVGPGADGLPGALAALLVPVVKASSDGTWTRVKACRADDCRWAFYDRSRNHSGTWCDMAICGNRTKVRAYRRRAPER
jgi:predicted RNA-binding Zn ribbon-like protein